MLIKTVEQYNNTKLYVMGYITKLINKTGIKHTSKLQSIYNDLRDFGYVRTRDQLRFLLKFINQDYKHKGTDLEILITDMEQFTLIQNNPNTLEKLFV